MSTSSGLLRITGMTAAVALLSGIGLAAWSADSDPDPVVVGKPGQPAAYVDTSQGAGPGMSADDAITQVEKSINSPYITRIAVADSGTSGIALAIDETAPSATDGQQTALTWEAAIAQGAIGELMHTDQARMSEVLLPGSVSVHVPSGESLSLDPLSIGAVAPAQVFASSRDGATDTELSEQAARNLEKFGLKPQVIEIRRPLGAALVVKASLADDSTIDWTLDDLRAALWGPTHEYEGILIELMSPSGESRLVAGSSYRTGLDALWFAPGQDARFGARHFTPAPLDLQAAN